MHAGPSPVHCSWRLFKGAAGRMRYPHINHVFPPPPVWPMWIGQQRPARDTAH
jgi:hypothetical protein